MSSASAIVHLNGVVQPVALNDPSVLRLPSTPATSARPRRHRPRFLGSREAGKRIAPGDRSTDTRRSASRLLVVVHVGELTVDFS